VRQAELGLDGLAVGLDGLHADAERLGGFLGRAAETELEEHLPLALAQPRHRVRRGRRDVGTLVGCGAVQRGQNGRRALQLGDEETGAGLQGLGGVECRVEHGEDHNPDGRMILPQLAHELQAVVILQHQIHDGGIGSQLAGEGAGRQGVVRLATDGEGWGRPAGRRRDRRGRAGDHQPAGY
jgi:hypothetical protein